MNRPAKFDAACVILGVEIRNRTNKQTHIYPHLAHRHVWIITASPRHSGPEEERVKTSVSRRHPGCLSTLEKLRMASLIYVQS